MAKSQRAPTWEDESSDEPPPPPRGKSRRSSGRSSSSSSAPSVSWSQGVIAFFVILLLSLALQLGGAAALQYDQVQDAFIVIALVMVGLVLQGLSVLGWLTFHAARGVGTRGVTVGRSLSAAALQAVLVPAAVAGGLYVLIHPAAKGQLPESVEPYAIYLPLAAGALGYLLATTIGLRTNLLRSFLTTVVAYGLVCGLLIGALTVWPSGAASLSAHGDYYRQRVAAWLQMHNMDAALREFRAKNADVMPASIDALRRATQPPTESQTSPAQAAALTEFWPLVRVRDGIILVPGWPTDTAGALKVAEVPEYQKLLVAYTDPSSALRQHVPDLWTAVTTPVAPGDTAKPAPADLPTTRPIGASDSVVLFADGRVVLVSAEDLQALLKRTANTLADARTRRSSTVNPAPAAPSTTVNNPPNKPAPQRPAERPAPAQGDPGELFPGRGR